MRPLIAALALLSTPVLAQRVLKISPLIETIRETPVFKAPGAKSQVLADAPPRTPLLVRALSSKGTWLMVEDEDGNRGWVPTSFTDFSALGTEPWDLNAPEAPATKAAPNIFDAAAPPPPTSTAAAPLAETSGPLRDFESEAPRPRREGGYSEHQLGLIGNVSTSDEAGVGGGLSYAFLPSAGDGHEQYGIWISALRRADQWELPLRFAGRSLSEDGRWARGADVELRYVRRVSGVSDWIFGLGYSGSVLLTSRFFVQGRGGLYFSEGVQGELGLQLGWNL
jgi:hypothetical protein